MASWDEISLVTYHDSGAVLHLSKSSFPLHDKQKSPRTCLPHFLLVRSACFGTHGQNWKNILLGLYAANIPSVNSLESLYLCQEKPVIYGKLLQIRNRLGKNRFPLIDSTYYSDWKSMTFSTGFPMVAKVGTAHAGFGKLRVLDEDGFSDFRSVIALQDRYVSTEPFIDWDYDIRIQKIGDHYRCWRRESANWKGSGFNQTDEDIEVEPRFREWIDVAADGTMIVSSF
eukprot:TRINITY_DN1002_c0_g1_i5.p1 TRINITY_DN1002_c0_g1~~TRINITY_DN1002_c0_g1_i5.p1  ORF type:complete len:266 (-),score=44.94 TRINITY_DN1002_c0_g1_i5:454-1137(-)